MSDTAVIEQTGVEDAPPPEAPPAPPTEGEPQAPEAPTGERTDVVELHDTVLPLGRFPTPDHLVGERVDQELVDSIASVGGLLQPVVVAVAPDADPDAVVTNDRIVAGRRRLQALWRLHERDAVNGQSKWGSVPTRYVVVRAEGVDLSATLLSLVDHATRRDNDAMTYAAVFKLTQTEGYDAKTLRDRTAMSLQTIQRIQRLSKLIPEFQKAMFEGKISGWVASKLSAFTPEEQTTLYERFEKNGKLVTKELDDIRRAQRESASGDAIDEAIKRVDTDDAPPAPEDSSAYQDLVAERDALKAQVEDLTGTVEALRTESEARLERIEAVRADGDRVIGELRATIETLQTERDASKPADVTTLEAQYESAVLDCERYERTVKLLKNDLARARKQSLPYPDLAKERLPDDE